MQMQDEWPANNHMPAAQYTCFQASQMSPQGLAAAASGPLQVFPQGAQADGKGKALHMNSTRREMRVPSQKAQSSLRLWAEELQESILQHVWATHPGDGRAWHVLPRRDGAHKTWMERHLDGSTQPKPQIVLWCSDKAPGIVPPM